MFSLLRLASVLVLALPPSAALAGVATPASSAGAGPEQACLTMPAHDYSTIPQAPTRILTSRVVPAQSPVPAYCDVEGMILGRIHFVLDLPLSGWNRDYVELGNGGFGGSIPTQTSPPTGYLQAGAAVASDDTGHVGTPLDATFAAGNNRQAQIDWGYLSEHVLAVAAKVIVPQFYGEKLVHTYYIGCSTGGRQALMESQRYPHDFQGIVAGDPANYQNLLAPLEQGYRELANRNSLHRLILTATDATTVQNAVVNYCTRRGDAVDGVLTDPRLCSFPIESLQCRSSGQTGCLSSAQVEVLARWYDIPRNNRFQPLYPADAGLPLGSEGGWLPYDITTDASFSLGGMFADQVLRYLAFPASPPPTYSLYDFDFNRDAAKLLPMAEIYNSDSTDLTAFQRSGGKLILYHGFSDPLISPYGSIDYYESVVRRFHGLPATQRWFRLFLLPGVYHCTGGPGPDTVDWYRAIRGWVAQGHSPYRLIATQVSNGQVTMSRPLFPYPREGRYVGHGDPTKWTSFVPVEGPRGTRIAVQFGPYARRGCETLCASG